MEDGRLQDILKDYWHGLKADRAGLPAEAEIDPEVLEKIWKNCFLVQIHSTHRYQYDYLGANLVDAYGEDYTTGDEADRLVSPYTNHAIQVFDEVVKNRQPMADAGEFVNSYHLLIKYRQYLLPFGKGDKVTHILGGMRWKAY